MIRDGGVTWQPVTNPSVVILGGQVVGALALLVLAHGLCGMLVLRAEREPGRPLHGRCALAAGVAVLAVLGIAWLVLAKPF